MRRLRRRAAFTITELLVAMALIIFILYILAAAFSEGSNAFRNLKAIGDMNEKLRNTGTLLRRHLERDHFEDKKRVSDPDFWKDGPPKAGFLRIYNGSPLVAGNPAYYPEGLDSNFIDSACAADHGLHFAVKLRGNNRGDYFRAGVPANSPLLALPLQDTRFQETTTSSVSSSWGEVVVFLQASGSLTDDPDNPNAVGLPLYTLYVRPRLLVPDDQVVKAVGPVPNALYGSYAEMSCNCGFQANAPFPVSTPPSAAGGLYFNNPTDVTMPRRRLGQTPGTAPQFASGDKVGVYPTLATENGAMAGNDVALANVLSFEVRVLIDRNQWAAAGGNAAQYGFVPLSHPVIQSFSSGNPAFPANTGPYVFDTWSQAKDDWLDYVGAGPTPLWATQGEPNGFGVPLYQNVNIKNGNPNIRLMAVQITIRIWDPNTKQARQSSVVVDL
jgi:type II secretory pathway pseudopilin PulG